MTCVPATRDSLDPFGKIFVNCPSLWRTCSTRHLGYSSLITVDQACTPSAKLVSGTSCKFLDEDFTTYQERLEGYLKTMLQRIRYQERPASSLTKILQRIRNVLHVT